jgi:hypothetical protein
MSARDECMRFGIGCLYFAVGAGCESPWKDAVKESLASIPRVSDVEIDLGIVLAQEATAGEGYYPTRGMLRFRLHVPLVEQKELHGLLQHITGTAEHFIVMVYFRYFEPVMFVLPEASTSWKDTFLSVIIVREYLQREFDRRKLPADIRVIGPTPLHANSCVQAGVIDGDFELVRVPSMADDRFTFLYSAERFSSSAMAAVTLFDSISHELSLYYSLVSSRDDRGQEGNEISVLIQKLINIYQAKGFKARMRRVSTSSMKIRQAALMIVNAEYAAQADDQFARRQLDELYSMGIVPYFKDFIEGEVASGNTGRISAAKEMVSLLDQARERQIEVMSLFLSAVAGGLAGALASLLIH